MNSGKANGPRRGHAGRSGVRGADAGHHVAAYGGGGRRHGFGQPQFVLLRTTPWNRSSDLCPCQNPRVAPYVWNVREGSLDGPLVMKEYVYDVPDKEPVEGQELYLSNGTGPWRVTLVEYVPEVPRSPYNILVVERLA